MMSKTSNKNGHKIAGLEEYKHKYCKLYGDLDYGTTTYLSLRYVSDGNSGSKKIKIVV